MMLSEKCPRMASESRKSTKSAMEKRRRARINGSLKELKSILAGIITYKGERFDKMEKADILEMTVQYVRKLQKNSNKGKANDHHNDEEYTSGVNSCLGEVIKYIATNSDCDTNVKTRILDHLAHRINGCSSDKDAESKMAKINCPSPPITRDIHPSMATTDTSCAVIRDSPQPIVINANLPAVSSDMSADSNNNCQETPNFNCMKNQNRLSPIEFQSCNQQLIDGTSQFVPVLQHVAQQSSVMQSVAQQPSVMQPVAQQQSVIQPLTLIVPANMYPAGMGTTCLVPITLSTSSQQQIINTSSPSYSNNCEVKPNENNPSSMQVTPPIQMSNLISNFPSRTLPVSPLHVQTSPIASTVTFVSRPTTVSTSQTTVSTSQSEVLSSNCVSPDHQKTSCTIVKPIPVNDYKCRDMPRTIYERLSDSQNCLDDHHETNTRIVNNKYMDCDNDARIEQFQNGTIPNGPIVRTVAQLHRDTVTAGNRMETLVDRHHKSQLLWRPF